MSKPPQINQFLPPFRAVIMAELIAVLFFIIINLFDNIPLNIIVATPLISAGILLIKVGSQTIIERLENFVKFLVRLLFPQLPKESPVFDTEIGTARIGMQWSEDTLITVLRVLPPQNSITILEPNNVTTSSEIDLSVIAKCLNQFDISLSDIDIIANGYQVWGDSLAALSYRNFLGPLASVAYRETWIILYFKPFYNPGPITLRGGGQRGTVKTMITATRRVAQKLNNYGIRTEFITSEQLKKLSLQFHDGIPGKKIKEKWSYAGLNNYRFYSYALNPKALSTTNLDKLWKLPSQSTLVGLSFKNYGKNAIQSYGLLRIGDFKKRKRRKFTTLYALLRGNQYRALESILPSNASLSHISPLLHKGNPDMYRDIKIATSGYGQVIGTDEMGRAVALPIVGPGISRVDISAEVQLVKQLLVRSLAIGAKVLVCTLRPQVWQSMANIQPNDDSFVVVNSGTLEDNSQLSLSFTAVVIDTHTPHFSLGSSSTLIALHDINTDLNSYKSDVQLSQDPQDLSSLRVVSGNHNLRLKTVVTREELAQTGITYIS